jgi:hypothetical protein
VGVPELLARRRRKMSLNQYHYVVSITDDRIQISRLPVNGTKWLAGKS